VASPAWHEGDQGRRDLVVIRDLDFRIRWSIGLRRNVN
jgi:hypothetical protein